ncbi:MAG: response regulator [Candidatus Ryanbacteria bacterium]|nr:response regulator [Candidatus Ryanbacteria bacterium]
MPQTKVLLVEESPSIRALIPWQLEGLDLAFIGTGSIKEAQAALRSERPDLMITEIVFRGGWRAGMQFVSDAHKARQDLAIIVHTAENVGGIADATMRIGAMAFVPKVSRVPNELKDTVRVYLPHK